MERRILGLGAFDMGPAALLGADARGDLPELHIGLDEGEVLHIAEEVEEEIHERRNHGEDEFLSERDGVFGEDVERQVAADDQKC